MGNCMEFIKKLKMKQPYDPIIMLFDKYLKECEST
jgi:hypothetical protein